MTRAEYIRSLSDEELAVFMCRLMLGRVPTDGEYLLALAHIQGENDEGEFKECDAE